MGARRNEINDLQAPDIDLEKLEKFFEEQSEPKVVVVGGGMPRVSAEAMKQLQEAGITIAEAAKSLEKLTAPNKEVSEKISKEIDIIGNKINDLKPDLPRPQSKYHK